MFINMQSTFHTDDINVLSGLTTFTPTVVVHILYLGFGTHRCGVGDRAHNIAQYLRGNSISCPKECKT